MNKTVKRIVFWAPLALLVAIIIAFLVLILPKLLPNNPTLEYLEYNDNLSQIDFRDANGADGQLDSDKYKILFFVAADCGDCIKHLPAIREFEKVFGENEPVQFMVMWEDEIPGGQVDQYQLKDFSYSLNNVRIASTYSTVIVADKDNNVVFVDGSGFGNFVKYLFDESFLDNEVLVENANQYIADTYSKDDSKDKLIYFSMPGCPDCEDATPIVYTDDIENQYEIIRIERDKGAGEGDIVDEYQVFQNVYAIDWFPSFLKIHDGSWDMVRKVELSGLKNSLLDA